MFKRSTSSPITRRPSAVPNLAASPASGPVPGLAYGPRLLGAGLAVVLVAALAGCSTSALAEYNTLRSLAVRGAPGSGERIVVTDGWASETTLANIETRRRLDLPGLTPD